jgi:hypothetical protein
MRSNRRRNWFLKRIALGLAIAAFAAPAAQAKVDEGSSVQANGYQAFVTDFPSSSSVDVSGYGMPRAMPSDYALASQREFVRADVPGDTVSSIKASDYGMPRAMPSDYALANREFVRADVPGDTVQNIGEPQVVRVDIPGDTVTDIGELDTPQVVAGGFDWSDAAIGGGLALGLVLLGWGAILATRHLGKTQTA